ncbi:MAG: hypothetical protein IID07_05160 [Gemmatimonadetes bacterium]|nr:hypothetical protein [Gemmatimonadota bacterium]
MSMSPIRFVRAVALFALPLSFLAGDVSGQDIEFDIDIARIGGGRFEPFVVSETESMRDAMSAGKLQNDTRLLVLDHPAGTLAFLTDQMTYHHVAQGEIDGEPWMVSF